MTSNATSAPVFICGLPRSGTTLLTTLLDGHPDLLVFPEETLFRQVSSLQFQSRSEWVDHILHQTNIRVMNTAYQVTEAERIGGTGIVDYSHFNFESFDGRVHALFEQSGGSAPELLESVIQAYALETNQHNWKYYVEKTPANEFRLHQYVKWWPHARFIYILRDPRAAYLSIKTKRSKESEDFSVEEFVYSWVRSLHTWIRYTGSLKNALLVHYEDVVDYKAFTLQKICSLLEITFDPIMLSSTKMGDSWVGMSSSGKPMGEGHSALGSRWQTELSSYEIRFIEAFLGKSMVAQGYRLSLPQLSAGEIFRLGFRQKNVGKREFLRSLLKFYAPFGTFWSASKSSS